ncbi:MAG: NAD(P)/FAD-dependent oxidoreductase [Planctomycetes bacterium]|nr:NAD(P)/FAD-dependent oxidoreductase [Planctomycetota bacterium]
MTVDSHYDAIIIGAGAAGLMCAIEAGKRGKRVLVCDHAKKIGKKILISGGGRCNFTNTYTNADNYLSQNSHYCKSALARYSPWDFIDFIEHHNIDYFEKKEGQLFCKVSSKYLLEALLKECTHYDIHFKYPVHIENVSKTRLEEEQSESAADNIIYRASVKSASADGDKVTIYESHNLVIATGGLSYPKIGATDFGLRIAEQFGLKTIKMQAALVPLISSKKTRALFSQLSGISMPALVKCAQTQFKDDILFTHHGMSGPAILQVSSYHQQGQEIEINFLPGMELEAWLEEQCRLKNPKKITNALKEYLPAKFLGIWAQTHNWPDQFKNLTPASMELICASLQQWQWLPAGNAGFEKAEVCRGGVDTNELSSKTMAARKEPKLFFIGEVVDVTGWLGGYNLQWAWASGYVAGQSL